jgi:hypothetical protein
MIAAFLLLALLGIGLAVFWIAWWLMADLFSGSARPVQARIRTVDEKPRTEVGIKRTVIGD